MPCHDPDAGRERGNVTRSERCDAIALALVRELHHGRWHEARVTAEARDNPVIRRLAEVALDTADATREPCECRLCICKTCGATYAAATGRECSCEP